MRSQPENRCLSKGVAFAPGPQFWWVFEESSGPPLSGPTTVLRRKSMRPHAAILRASIHGGARREHLALLSGRRLAAHADGCLGAAAVYYQNPERRVPSWHGVVPDCSGQPTPARSSADASRSAGSRNPGIPGGSFLSAVRSKHWPAAPVRGFVEP